MPLLMPTDQFPTRPVIIMIVGTPFSYKTSLVMTAENPILIDGDRGSDRAVGRCPVFIIKNGWAEVEEEEKAGLFNGFKTCIIDTPKSVIDDFMMERCQQISYSANMQKVYGNVGTMFKLFVAARRSQDMDLLIVSHEKSKDQNDKTVYEPDITGQSKQLLLRMCDQVGFMWKQEVKGQDGKMAIRTVLTFNPKPEWPFCKNVAGLPDMVIPNYTLPEWKGFFNREVVLPTKNAISTMTDEQRHALEFIEEWHLSIDALLPEDGKDDVTGAELLTTMGEITKIEPEHIKKQIRAYFQAHLKKIGWMWVDAKKAFTPKEAKVKEEKPAGAKSPETPPAPPTPPAEDPQSQTPDSNPAGLAMKSGNMGDGVDLFAPRGDHAQDAFDQEQAEMERDMQREGE